MVECTPTHSNIALELIKRKVQKDHTVLKIGEIYTVIKTYAVDITLMDELEDQIINTANIR